MPEGLAALKPGLKGRQVPFLHLGMALQTSFLQVLLRVGHQTTRHDQVYADHQQRSMLHGVALDGLLMVRTEGYPGAGYQSQQWIPGG